MPNRLAQESSPYLLQHANNPVDWYPWGPAALEKARAEDKPILLSIGYSTCHWCHVMARECFEDAEVAEVMNRLFVSIKVDREERPDLDQIYQTAHQIFAQRGGGWPLTMFLTPDQLPFYAGTYFPKHARHNLPGFVQLMQQVERAYRERRQDIEAQNQQLLSALAQNEPAASGDAQFDSKPLDAARAQLAQSFRSALGRLFQGAKISPSGRTGVPVAPDFRREGPGHGVVYPRAHAARRAHRPTGRRLLPLFGGRALGDSALRKNALRQWPSAGA